MTQCVNLIHIVPNFILLSKILPTGADQPLLPDSLNLVLPLSKPRNWCSLSVVKCIIFAMRNNLAHLTIIMDRSGSLLQHDRAPRIYSMRGNNEVFCLPDLCHYVKKRGVHCMVLPSGDSYILATPSIRYMHCSVHTSYAQVFRIQGITGDTIYI